MTSLATKYGKAEKITSCRYPSAHQVSNASPAQKASKVQHQVESLESPNRAEWGGDNTPVGLCGPHVQQKWGHGPQCKQQHTKTRGPHERANRVISQMSIQIHTGETKALEPRKRTKQLSHQREAPKSKATYHHWPLQEHQYSANSKWQGGCWMNWAAAKLQASHQQDLGLTPPRGWPEP